MEPGAVGGKRGAPRTQELGPGPEFDRVREALREGLADLPDRVRVGPGDDCAVLEEGTLVLGTDLSVEGVHFRRDWLEPEEIGYRAAAAALSDLAAMAARPVGVLVSMAVEPGEAGVLVAPVHRGVREALAGVGGGGLLGGDLAASPGPLVLDVVAVGEVREPVLRGGARPGDELWVTGRLGGGAAAVRALREGRAPGAGARERFARPRPRVREALWLAERVPLRALIDLSDGLAGDAAHMAAASGAALVLEPARLPLDPAAREEAGDGALELALHGGEDFELLVAAPPRGMEPLAGLFEAEFGTPLVRVGEVREGSGVLVREGDGVRPLGRGGFDHFRGGEP